MARRILLLHDFNQHLDATLALLEQAGLLVVHVDHQDLYWPKFIETTAWDAVLVDESVVPHILVELASELGHSLAAAGEPVILISSNPLPALPSSMKSAVQVENATEAIKELNSG